MGKRSNFERIPRDYYPTPPEAIVPLIPHLINSGTFCEPCAGDGRLLDFITSFSYYRCVAQFDIEPRKDFIVQKDALELTKDDIEDADYLITNPPWDRKILHPMIEHFMSLAPTWLLFDADWMHTKQAVPYLRYCTDIISVGRVKWIPDSKMTGKDNCAWYLFNKGFYNQRITFHARDID